MPPLQNATNVPVASRTGLDTSVVPKDHGMNRVDLWRRLAEAKALRTANVAACEWLVGNRCPGGQPCSHAQAIGSSALSIFEILDMLSMSVSGDDEDILDAYEHLAVSFHHLRMYAASELYYRRVLEGRLRRQNMENQETQKEKNEEDEGQENGSRGKNKEQNQNQKGVPPRSKVSTITIRDTRRYLVSAVCHGLRYDEDAFLQMDSGGLTRSLERVACNALDLMLENINEKQPDHKANDDLDFALYLFERLEQLGKTQEALTPTYDMLLRKKMRQLAQLAKAEAEAGHGETEQRLAQVLRYGETAIDVARRHGRVLQDGRLGYRTCREALLHIGGHVPADVALLQTLTMLDTDWKNCLQRYVRGRWHTVLQAVQERVRAEVLPTKKATRDAWWALLQRLRARKRWARAGNHARGLARERITEHRTAVIDRWRRLVDDVVEDRQQRKDRSHKRWDQALDSCRSLARERIAQRRAEAMDKWHRLADDVVAAQRQREAAEKQAQREELVKRQLTEEDTAEREREQEKQAAQARAEEERAEKGRIEAEQEERRQKREEQEGIRQQEPTEPPVQQLAESSRPETTQTMWDSIGALLYDSTPSGDLPSKRWLDDFVAFRTDLLRPLSRDDARVRVTVIDTGIDGTHPFLLANGWKPRRSKTVSLYKDFVSGDGGETPEDNDGHGTFVAGILCQLAPDVELSVARIGNTRAEMAADKKIADKVYHALKHAVDFWKTDIVSMSFSLPTYADSVAVAIEQAAHPPRMNATTPGLSVNTPKRTVFLAAAGNSGRRTKIPFPASHSDVLKIFASKHTGYAADFSPPDNRTGACFSTLGCAVPSTWPAHLCAHAAQAGLSVSHGPPGIPGTWTTMTGTSFATPIVAALVAILYQFHQCERGYFDSRWQSPAQFRSTDAVREMLGGLSHPPSLQGPYYYLDPNVTRHNSGNRLFSHSIYTDRSLKRYFAEQLSNVLNNCLS